MALLSLASLPDLDPSVTLRESAVSAQPGMVVLGVTPSSLSLAGALSDTGAGAHSGAFDFCAIEFGEPAFRDVLYAQDGCYSLRRATPAGASDLRVIRGLRHLMLAPKAPHRALQTLAARSVHTVVFALGEKRLCLDEIGHGLDHGHADIVHDLHSPHGPQSAIGVMVFGLARRRALGLEPFTTLTASALPDAHGHLRRQILAFAEMINPKLAAWIDEHAVFVPSLWRRRAIAGTAALPTVSGEPVDDHAALIAQEHYLLAVADHDQLSEVQRSNLAPRLESDVARLAQSALLAHDVLLGLAAALAAQAPAGATPPAADIWQRLEGFYHAGLKPLLGANAAPAQCLVELAHEAVTTPALGLPGPEALEPAAHAVRPLLAALDSFAGATRAELDDLLEVYARALHQAAPPAGTLAYHLRARLLAAGAPPALAGLQSAMADLDAHQSGTEHG